MGQGQGRVRIETTPFFPLVCLFLLLLLVCPSAGLPSVVKQGGAAAPPWAAGVKMCVCVCGGGGGGGCYRYEEISKAEWMKCKSLFGFREVVRHLVTPYDAL